MAKYVEFPEQNFVWKGNGDNVGDLPCFVFQSEEYGFTTISCWELSEEELAEVAKTGKVWLTVIGQHPPVIIDGKKILPS